MVVQLRRDCVPTEGTTKEEESGEVQGGQELLAI